MFDFTFLPISLREKLMPFQREGVQYAIEKRGRCLIGDEMGLGKTIQAIAVAYYYRGEWPLLIVLPSSMKYPWIEELEKWLPCLQPRDVNLITSSTDISNISKAAISLVGYGLMRASSKTLLEALNKQNFQVVILDESHFLKNPKAARTKTLVPLLTKAKRVLMLSGTPALARPAELFPQINCLTNGKFGSWTSYAKRYCDAKFKFFGRMRRWDTTGASNLEELHQKLTSTVMIRREKKEVLSELPPKRRQKIPFELAESPQKKELEKLWATLGLYLKGKAPADAQGTDEGFEIRRLAMELYILTGKAKIAAISEYIKMLLDNQEMKFLVFAHHKEILTAIVQTAQAYAREKEPTLKYIRIDGDVPPAERMKDVNRFQQDPNVRVAALSIMAAGTGLTLTAASHVVFAELHWTPGVLEQCEDRAHRIGQLSAIHVHYLVARGTIDEWMWSALNRKVGVLSSALNGRTKQLDAEVLMGGISDFLKQAEFWIPSDLDEEEEDSYFFSQSQKQSSQDIRSFFQPSQSRNKTLALEDRFKDEPSPVISLVDSDESEDDITPISGRHVPAENGSDNVEGRIDSFSEPGEDAEMTISEITGESEMEAVQNNKSKTMNGSKGKDLKKSRPLSERAETLTNVLPPTSHGEAKAKHDPSSTGCGTSPSVDSSSLLVERTTKSMTAPQSIPKEKAGHIETSPTQREGTTIALVTPVCSESGSITHAGKMKQEELNARTEMEKQQNQLPESSRDRSSLFKNTRELYVSESSDSDCELIVGARLAARKKRGQKSSQSSCTEGTPSSQNTPSSALDRRQDFYPAVLRTPDNPSHNLEVNENLEDNANLEKQWGCSACTFLNHGSLHLCEICDTPRRREEKQRRINTRSRVSKKQRSNKDGGIILEAFSGSDDDFETLQRVVPSSDKRKTLDRVGGVCKKMTSDKFGPGKSSRKSTCLTQSDIRVRDECPVSSGTSKEESCCIVDGEGGMGNCAKRLYGTSQEADVSNMDDSDLDMQGKSRDQKEQESAFIDRTSKNRSHGIDISDSDSLDSFLNVNPLRANSQEDGQAEEKQVDQRHHIPGNSQSGVPEESFNSVTSEGTDNTIILGAEQESLESVTNSQALRSGTNDFPRNGDPGEEFRDALFSDEDDSENVKEKIDLVKKDAKVKDFSQTEIEKEVKDAVECILSSPKSSGSMVRPWKCSEPSCQFVNTSSGVECENCWAPNPKIREGTSGGNIKVHNLGLRKSPGFISASQVLAQQGGKNVNRSCEMTPRVSELTTTDTEPSLPEPKKYEAFLYCASKFTERIYLYDVGQKPLDCSFQPLDLRTRDMDNLPALLKVPHNMRIARIFLREWDSLTEMKKRKLHKSGEIFDNPATAVDALMKKRPIELSKRRFLTKDDLANAALQKAEEVGGSVRVIHRKKAAQTLTSPPRVESLQFIKSPSGENRKRKGVSDDSGGEGSSGGQEISKKMRHDDDNAGLLAAKSSFVQAVGADGVPLCVLCNGPVEAGDLSNRNAAWDTRYCSETCKQEHKVRWKNSKYVRDQLLETEHGICQICQLDANSIYRNIRDVPKSKRKEFLSKTAYRGLSSKLLNEMIRNPSQGQFWHADHIVPVYKGGGLCSLENFRTLCVLCHAKVTAEQSHERRESRITEANKKAGLRDIRMFLKDKDKG